MLSHTRKELGAFYTPERVASFLTSWAIRTKDDSVLDPSAGEGVFLHAARLRLLELGGIVWRQATGVEMFAATHRAALQEFPQGPSQPTLKLGDFFDQSPIDLGPVTAIIGNPPFVRFQRFSGNDRKKALARAAEAGVALSELSSSWAPFLVHAATFIAPGGRMAVVAPAELAHATYAQPVVRFLCSSFRNVNLLVFKKRLFPDISEDTVLLLASGRGEAFEELRLHKLNDADSLSEFPIPGSEQTRGESAIGLDAGVTRLVEYFLPSATRQLYRELAQHTNVARFGDVANVGIGYVTGNNAFFHLSTAQARSLGIKEKSLRRAVRNGRSMDGLIFSRRDWNQRRDAGESNLLLHIQGDEPLDPGLKRYLAVGRRSGADASYKCRMRERWFSVPHVHTGDAFVTYMSGKRPKLFLNGAQAVAPNTLHVVRCLGNRQAVSRDLVVGWNSSLTGLSCEIEGHGLGGGMLKLEPKECSRVLVPMLSPSSDLTSELDQKARRTGRESVEDRVDVLMATALGIDRRDIQRLKVGQALLRERRTGSK